MNCVVHSSAASTILPVPLGYKSYAAQSGMGLPRALCPAVGRTAQYNLTSCAHAVVRTLSAQTVGSEGCMLVKRCFGESGFSSRDC